MAWNHKTLVKGLLGLPALQFPLLKERKSQGPVQIHVQEPPTSPPPKVMSWPFSFARRYCTASLPNIPFTSIHAGCLYVNTKLPLVHKRSRVHTWNMYSMMLYQFVHVSRLLTAQYYDLSPMDVFFAVECRC